MKPRRDQIIVSPERVVERYVMFQVRGAGRQFFFDNLDEAVDFAQTRRGSAVQRVTYETLWRRHVSP